MLVRFRIEQVGVIADIKKAFLQIGLSVRDRDFLRFIWYDQDGYEKTYRHARVVFGVTCSPFLLAAVLNYHLQNALERCCAEDSVYSEKIVKKLLNAFYVDNVVASVKKEELEAFIKESTSLLEEGKFVLRGWEHTQLNEESCIRSLSPVLGLLWNTATDTIQLSLEWFRTINLEVISKRIILSAAHKLYDPIGFSSPVALYPKLLLQRAWAQKIGWDKELTKEICDDFLHWMNEIPCLEKMKIPRWLFSDSFDKHKTLHVFCDASKDAYATCVFIRSESPVGVCVRLVQAKARVAPIKKLSIPRLELLAATIGTRLLTSIIENFEEDIQVYFWTDSTTVLSWIKRDEQWKPYVWNRIEEIRRLSNKENWFHVPSDLNPADLPSRGCSAKKLVEGRWWEGPLWLQNPISQWPSEGYQCDEDEIYAERKKNIISAFSNATKRDFSWYYTYFSNYDKIVALVGWVMRFVNNSRKSVSSSKAIQLSVAELDSAEKVIIRLMQEECFKSVKDAKLATLSVFLDSESIMRIKMKISYRPDETESFRFPYVLPTQHEVVHRLILKEHYRNCHVGVQGLMSILRERFWILKYRRTVKSVIRKCQICRRYDGKRLAVESLPLPVDRVKDASAFEIVGVDLAGPLYIKTGEKVWIVLYTCAVYRAIHLELADSLSTEAFLQSLRRFIGRRGRPATIYSDNGTNFVGTNNAFRQLEWNKIYKECGVRKIEWKFIPPTAPWWGGWWERLVGLVKNLLRKVLGKSKLTFQELHTVLCDCEAIVNARPLTYISDDAADLAPLTPAMFIQDRHNSGVADIDDVEANDLRRRYRYRLKLKEDLRKRFKYEYLGQLALVSKRQIADAKLKIGDVVLITNDNEKKINYLLGRVKELIHGRDGKVRVVRLKTTGGECLRPIQRLCLLEMNEKDSISVKEKGKERNATERENLIEENEIITRYGRKIKPPSRYGNV